MLRARCDRANPSPSQRSQLSRRVARARRHRAPPSPPRRVQLSCRMERHRRHRASPSLQPPASVAPPARTPSLRTPVAVIPAEPPGGALSPSSSTPLAAAAALAEPPGGACSPPSSTPVAPERVQLSCRMERHRRHRPLLQPPASVAPPVRTPSLRTISLRLVGGSAQLVPAELY